MNKDLKKEAVRLRMDGKTYTEIRNQLGGVSKGTLSYWFKDIVLPADYSQKARENNLLVLSKARICAVEAKKAIRLNEIKSIFKENVCLREDLKNKNTGKIALVMLYLGEGMKNRKNGAMMLGNSDPITVSLFMHLLRSTYEINESKFRCTLQCRADQDIKGLEFFWSNVTKVPLSQFYKAQVDPRTVGKPSKKPDYKGVCRIDYFSAKIFAELLEIPQILYKGL